MIQVVYSRSRRRGVEGARGSRRKLCLRMRATQARAAKILLFGGDNHSHSRREYLVISWTENPIPPSRIAQQNVQEVSSSVNDPSWSTGGNVLVRARPDEATRYGISEMKYHKSRYLGRDDVNIKFGGDEIVRHALGGACLEKKRYDMAIAWRTRALCRNYVASNDGCNRGRRGDCLESGLWNSGQNTTIGE